MKVLDHVTIRGRGILTVIDALPAGLECGDDVRCGVRLYRVVGIETHAMPRSHTNGKPAGLLLDCSGEGSQRADHEPPPIGGELTVEKQVESST